jgi:hypothetical protein
VDLLVIGLEVDENALSGDELIRPIGFSAIPLDIEAAYELAVIGELHPICDLISHDVPLRRRELAAPTVSLADYLPESHIISAPN